jgi:hypothetical protein
MRQKILAGTTVLAIAIGMTTSATAFDRTKDGSRVGAMRTGKVHGLRATHGSRFAGVRSHEAWHHGGWSGRRSIDSEGITDLGPLGFTFGRIPRYGYCPSQYCGPGYSIAAWSL